MPKGSFICKNCKRDYKASGVIWSSEKYKCLRHGEICVRCVRTKFLGGKLCPKCENTVVQYEYNSSYGKWMKA